MGVDKYGLKAKMAILVEVGIASTDARFMVDTVSQASRIRAEVAYTMKAKEEGAPSWMDPFVAAKYHITDVSFPSMGWIGKMPAANPKTGFRLTTLPFKFPMPAGACGVVGIEFLKRLDWDFNFGTRKVDVAVTPKREPLRSQKPVPFDLTGMKVLPVSTVHLPVPLLACPVELRHNDGWLYLTGIIDLAAPCTMCNRIVAKRLGIDPRSGADELHKTFQVEMLMGDGADGPVRMNAAVVVGVDNDIKRFKEFGLAEDWPTVLLGPDVLSARA